LHRALKIILFHWYLFVFTSNAQNFVNPDLEGVEITSQAPTGWQMIPFGDPVCQAYIPAGCTPDITGPTGPVPSLGIWGMPNSGQTFVSGLHTGWPGFIYHEGIMQDVSGLIPGEDYPIEFYQAVVKQDNMQDNSGSWAVYMENTLIAVTTPSFSSLSYLDINLQWDYRSITFTATNTSHLIKFIPLDDDPSQIQPDEGLRMGIDGISFINPGTTTNNDTICEGDTATLIAYGASIYQWAEESNPSVIIGSDDTLFVTPSSTTNYFVYTDIDTNIVSVIVKFPPIVELGIDQTICEGDTIIVNAYGAEISNYYWSNSSTDSILIIEQPGIYWVIVDNECGSVTDSIEVIEVETIEQNFAFDSITCNSESIVLEPSIQGDNYLWSNGETSFTLVVDQDGTYWLQISNSCYTTLDTFTIEYINCETDLEMPNVFSPNNDGINDNFVPIQSNSIELYELVILNRWGNTLFQSNALNTGWDGSYKGLKCSEGVYFWQVVFSDSEGMVYQEHGHVTLMK
jgi:gliding motility-associated-like protein